MTAPPSSFAQLHTPRRCRVQFPQAVVALDYALPAQMHLQIGEIIAAPLGKQLRAGVVEAILPEEPRKPGEKVIRYKEVAHRFAHLPPLSTAHREYLRWLADYYLCETGAALRLALKGNPDFYAPLPPQLTYIATGTEAAKLSTKQQALLDAIAAQSGTKTPAEMLREANCTSVQMKALLEKGLIRAVTREEKPPTRFDLPKLNPEQEQVFHALRADLPDADNRASKVNLLDGETGSGKTEVYFHLMAEALQQNKQILVLLPEVSLLVDWQKRFHARFGFAPHCWHNAITPKTRQKTWQACAMGKANVIAGARSALHLPFANLGLIIVDEEHDLSYKQEDGVCYHARDMAVLRAHLARIPIVLASATPSMESLENVQSGKYRHHRLYARYKDVAMPVISCIDLREHKPKVGEWLSPVVVDALHENLEQQQQSLLFLNRRGFAPLMLCRYCGFRIECPNCSVYLTEHRHPTTHLQCHHCQYRTAVPSQCAQCGEPDGLSSAGPGIERIMDNVRTHFPKARTFAATADTLDQPQSIADFLQSMVAGEIDIVVGTQILAKGLDFPRLSLACVLDADQAFFGSNPRASEQTWQLLHQIAGRTGRHEFAGKALIQTRNPEDGVFECLVNMDRDGFYAQQRLIRERASLPPFGNLLAIVVLSKDEQHGAQYAKRLTLHAPKTNESLRYRLLGPLPAPIAKLRGWYRQRLLLMSAKTIHLQSIVRHMFDHCPPDTRIRIKIDVDPYNFV